MSTLTMPITSIAPYFGGKRALASTIVGTRATAGRTARSRRIRIFMCRAAAARVAANGPSYVETGGLFA